MKDLTEKEFLELCLKAISDDATFKDIGECTEQIYKRLKGVPCPACGKKMNPVFRCETHDLTFIKACDLCKEGKGCKGECER